MSEIENLLATTMRIVQETVETDAPIQPDDQLLQSGILDSVSVLQIYLALQSELDVDLDIEDITEESFASIRTITELLERRMS